MMMERINGIAKNSRELSEGGKGNKVTKKPKSGGEERVLK
jgi:hypothetical protein